MRKIVIACIFIDMMFAAVLGVASVAQAETHIDGETDFGSGAAWTASGSPYILDADITIPENKTLTIGPGVTVTTSTSSPGSLYVRGTILVDGRPGEPVMIDSLNGFWISYSTSTISHAIIDTPAGLSVTKSNVTISSSTITDAERGIDAEGSSINITDSVISGNDYGIYSEPMPVLPHLVFNFFGIPVAHAEVEVSDNPDQNLITISSSSIIGNASYGIFNSTINTVHAENNWWGSPLDPQGAISGNVDYAPWLMQDPNATTSQRVCCSNVLFFPGIEASRLYMDQRTIGGGTSTNQLWEPNRNADVEKLYMTPTGQSINSGIYTKDIIDSPFGLPVFPIYKSFIAMMNGVVADKSINSWQAYPYDWRFGVDTVVSDKLVSTLQSLASTSKTGKVTIVAHSDGGLVAKLLAKTLADRGMSGLLDKVIMVAVPQWGTPQAIPGLLHGDGESILGGIITTQSIARKLADNMPGAYGLLPSKAYFANLFAPVISIASSAISSFNFSGDGSVIAKYGPLQNFLSGLTDHRPNPSDAETNMPAVLHPALLAGSDEIHDIIDFFSFASTTKEIILAGWNRLTLDGISYYAKTSCSNAAVTLFLERLTGTSSCTISLEHSASTTLLGDDTVVLTSAIAGSSTSVEGMSSNVSNYYYDLGSESKDKISPDGHSNILSTDSGVAFVRQEITATSSVPSQGNPDQTLPPYISSQAPTLADVREDDLVVSVHSPVELNMYDSQGRHTGPIPNPDPTSDLGRYEIGIPGSDYVPNDDDTYIRVPYGTDYKVTFSGTGMGSFEVDTEHDVNGVAVAATTFADMPVTPLLKAELVLATTTSLATASTSTSSSKPTSTTTQMILFDFDGNGTIDATSTPHDSYDPILDMESEQTIISSMNLSPAKEKILRDKLATIIDCLRKKKPIRTVAKPNAQAIAAAQQAIADLQNQHWIFRNLDPARKQKLEDIFQAFLDNIDVQ